MAGTVMHLEPAMDARCGRLPLIRQSDTTITFEFGVLGGVLREELFVPLPCTRLVIHCDRSGNVGVRILNGRSSGV